MVEHGSMLLAFNSLSQLILTITHLGRHSFPPSLYSLQGRGLKRLKWIAQSHTAHKLQKEDKYQGRLDPRANIYLLCNTLKKNFKYDCEVNQIFFIHSNKSSICSNPNSLYILDECIWALKTIISFIKHSTEQQQWLKAIYPNIKYFSWINLKYLSTMTNFQT